MAVEGFKRYSKRPDSFPGSVKGPFRNYGRNISPEKAAEELTQAGYPTTANEVNGVTAGRLSPRDIPRFVKAYQAFGRRMNPPLKPEEVRSLDLAAGERIINESGVL